MPFGGGPWTFLILMILLVMGGCYYALDAQRRSRHRATRVDRAFFILVGILLIAGTLATMSVCVADLVSC